MSSQPPMTLVEAILHAQSLVPDGCFVEMSYDIRSDGIKVRIHSQSRRSYVDADGIMAGDLDRSPKDFVEHIKQFIEPSMLELNAAEARSHNRYIPPSPWDESVDPAYERRMREALDGRS